MTKEFEKKFWEEALQDPYAIIVGGTCLHIGSENTDRMFKGFSGAKFKFESILLLYNPIQNVLVHFLFYNL